jgi:outer membrane protein OmpA-like peptidoglycan-associated protein
MKRASIRCLGGLTAIVVSTGFASSCSSPTHLPSAATTTAVRSLSASTWPITQVEFGREAAFARCGPPACPSVTPKTLALESRPVPAAALPINTATSLAAGESLTPAVADAPREAPGLARATAPLPEEPLTRQVVVHFAFGDASLSPAARALIDEVAEPLATARRIAIRGRTDSVGPPHSNQWLATARANAVRDHVRSRYPHLAHAVTLEAQGACCFAASNDTPQGRAMNRRVEVVFERDTEKL